MNFDPNESLNPRFSNCSIPQDACNAFRLLLTKDSMGYRLNAQASSLLPAYLQPGCSTLQPATCLLAICPTSVLSPKCSSAKWRQLQSRRKDEGGDPGTVPSGCKTPSEH